MINNNTNNTVIRMMRLIITYIETNVKQLSLDTGRIILTLLTPEYSTSLYLIIQQNTQSLHQLYPESDMHLMFSNIGNDDVPSWWSGREAFEEIPVVLDVASLEAGED